MREQKLRDYRRRNEERSDTRVYRVHINLCTYTHENVYRHTTLVRALAFPNFISQLIQNFLCERT